jgi:chromate transporter
VPPEPGETSGTESAPPRAPVSLLHLFLMAFQVGIFSFGGGLTGWMYQEVVVRRRWMREDDFLSGLALAQILPGINVTNLIVYIGQRLRGVAGACIGLVGLLVGPFFAVIGLALVYQQIAGLTWLHATMDGMAAAAIGLLLFVGFKGAQRLARRPAPMLIIIVTVVTVGLLEWPLVAVVLCLAPVSVGLAWAHVSRDA